MERTKVQPTYGIDILANLYDVGLVDLHRTATIIDQYLHERSDYYEASTRYGLAKSKLNCRSFWTSNDCHGLPSVLIEENDMLCYMTGIRNPFVVRPQQTRGFILISQSVLVS